MGSKGNKFFKNIIRSMDCHSLESLKMFCKARSENNLVTINAINEELKRRNEKSTQAI